MRKIKFRGYSRNLNRWVYGDLVRGAFDGTSMEIEVGIQKPGYYPVAVDPQSVGQFAELSDTEGNEIYEGDVIYIAGYGNYLVEFPFFELYDRLYSGEASDVEKFLGNIHDNPELESKL